MQSRRHTQHLPNERSTKYAASHGGQLRQCQVPTAPSAAVVVILDTLRRTLREVSIRDMKLGFSDKQKRPVT